MVNLKILAAIPAALVFAGPGAASISYWSAFDASQRLETGRFAARYDVDNAICLGVGAMKTSKYGEHRFRLFDCTAWGKGFENERQLTLRVTGLTSFAVKWLKPQTCTVP